MSDSLPDDLAERRALAKAISTIETGGAAAIDVEQQALQSGSHAHVLGITGPPGAGKSSLVNALIPHALASYGAVAVLAVDPSSTVSGGALLGDRVRVDYRHFKQRVFFRSMASRGHQGGVAAATRAAINVLEAAGWPLVIVETLGIGQVELDIIGLADQVAIVLNPGWGDGFQANKAGLTEQGDVFVINKADRPGLEQTQVQLKESLQCLPGAAPPEVFPTVAPDGKGVPELWNHLRELLAQDNSNPRRKRREGALLEAAHSALLEDFRGYLETTSFSDSLPTTASVAELLANFYRSR